MVKLLMKINNTLVASLSKQSESQHFDLFLFFLYFSLDVTETCDLLPQN